MASDWNGFIFEPEFDAPAPDVVELNSTSVTEVVFGTFGPVCTANGWCVIPQQKVGKRLPSVYRRDVIKPSLYWEEGPSAETVAAWAKPLFNENVALIMGRPSGYVFAIDIDVLDIELTKAIEATAFRVLGPTRFRRVGKAPKEALLYRAATPEDMPASISRHFVEEDGTSLSEHALEILSSRHMLTVFGRHHQTGEFFTWTGLDHPAFRRPEDVPTVTKAQIDEFILQVQDIRGFYRNFSSGPVDLEMLGWVKTDGVNLPKVSASSAGSTWAEVDGLVVDGREKFLWSLARLTAKANPGNCADEEGRAKLKKKVIEEFRARALIDGRWVRDLEREAFDKVDRAAAGIMNGSILPMAVRQAPPPSRRSPPAPRRTARGTPAVGEAAVERDRSLDFTCGSAGVGRRGSLSYSEVDGTKARIEANRLDRALVPDRREIADQVSRGIDGALDSFFEAVYGGDAAERAKVHLLVAPTGSGKTSKMIKRIGIDPRTRQWDDAEDVEAGEVPGPILFLLPTYHNIDELRLKAEVLNLDKGLSDVDLATQALERDLFPEEEIEMRLADLRRDAEGAGLRTMIYRGKKAAGCRMVEKLDLLMAAGVGTAGLCKAERATADGEAETVFCEHYATCDAILQRRRIAESHVVFLPHAFLTMTIPEELRKARAVVADERIFHLFVHTTEFEAGSLQLARRMPRLTKKEKEAGKDPNELIEDRDAIAYQVLEGMRTGMCPVNYISRYTDGKRTALDFVRSALRVCGNAIASDTPITPDTSLEDIAEMCRRPTGTQISEEYRFWKIVEERLEQMIDDRAARSLLASAGLVEHPGAKLRCKGDREYRIQAVLDESDTGVRSALIRISWRSSPNWADCPIMLLDASASPDIVRKLFGGREVVVHDVPAPLNVKTVAVIDRTFSNMAVVGKGGTVQDRREASRTRRQIQSAISMASAVFGYGRMVVGASVLVRRAINTAWRVSSNVDFCHYGAMRGLDFAKHHVAALSVGRMEIPIRTVDGLVAALVYDDDEPEEPFDRGGMGVGPNGEVLRIPLEKRAVPHRDGRDIEIDIPVYPGRWARIIQQQYREEELKQFLGRLRPVYREGEAPVWIAISKVIPEGVVIDDFVSLEDLLRRSRGRIAAWEALRVTDGVAFPELMEAARQFERTSRVHWVDEMSRIGFDFQTGVLDPKSRYAWGFRPVTIERGEGVEYAFVRSEIANAADAVEAAFARFLGEEVSVISVGAPVRKVEKGSVRAPDWVETDLGTMFQRELDEARISAEAATFFAATLEADAYEAPRAAAETLPVVVGMPLLVTRAKPGGDDDTDVDDDRTIVERLTHDENAAFLAAEEMLRRLALSKGAPTAQTLAPREVDDMMGATLDEDGTY